MNPAVKSINGIDKAIFQEIFDRTGSMAEVNKMVAATSNALLQDMALKVSTILNPDGTPVPRVEQVGSDSFFDGAGIKGTDVPPANSNVFVRDTMTDHISQDQARATTLGEGFKNIAIGDAAIKLATGASALLGIGGLILTGVQIYQVGSDAKAAYDNGDTLGAASIIAKGTAEISTAWAAGLLASDLALAYVAALAPTGPVGIVLGIAFVAAAGIGAGWLGATTVKKLLEGESAAGGASPSVSVVDGWKITRYESGVVIAEAANGTGAGGYDREWILPSSGGGYLQIQQNTSTGQNINYVWSGVPGKSDLISKTATTPESGNVVKVETTTFDKASGETTVVAQHKSTTDDSVLDTTTTVIAADKSARITIDDGHGNTATATFDSQGNKTSDSWRNADGSNGTNIYDATTGQKIADTWQRPDGSCGSDSFNPNDGSRSSIAYSPDGSHVTVIDDGRGNTVTSSYDPNGVKLNDSWRNIDGSNGTDIYDATGQRVADTWQRSDGSYGSDSFNPYNGSGSGIAYDPDGSHTTYTNDGKGNVETSTYSPTGVQTSHGWQQADGSYGTDYFKSDGSTSGVSVRPDGTYQRYADDGKGNIVIIDYDPNGVQRGTQWWKSDGSFGKEIVNSDGSRSGTNYSPDGSYVKYSRDGNGNETATAYDAQGKFLETRWTNADGSSGQKFFDPKTGNLTIAESDGRGGQTITVYFPDGAVRVTVLNTAGVSVYDDGHGTRIETQWGPDGVGIVSNTIIRYNEDGSGTVTVTDADGRVTETQYGPGSLGPLTQPETPSDAPPQIPLDDPNLDRCPSAWIPSETTGDKVVGPPWQDSPQAPPEDPTHLPPPDTPPFEPPYKDTEKVVCPLVLDLDGNGVAIAPPQNGGAYFDHDGDGFAEKSSWISPNDGFLVRDRNGNGKITTGDELFGDQTRMKDGRWGQNGFDVLAEYDDNHDGKINAQDGIWGDLQVWRDANRDGISQVDELHPLSDFGIQSFAVAYSQPGGRGTLATGHYTKTDGSTLNDVDDPIFKAVPWDTRPTEVLPVTEDIARLPNLPGYGKVLDLRQAMLKDTSGALKALVQKFAAESTQAGREALLTQILLRWTNSEGIDPTSRYSTSYGIQYDARKLNVIEQFNGVGLIQPYADSGKVETDPMPESVPLLNASYDALFEMMYSQLMEQTRLKGLFE